MGKREVILQTYISLSVLHTKLKFVYCTMIQVSKVEHNVTRNRNK